MNLKWHNWLTNIHAVPVVKGKPGQFRNENQQTRIKSLIKLNRRLQEQQREVMRNKHRKIFNASLLGEYLEKISAARVNGFFT